MVTIQSNTGSAKQYSFTLSVTEPKSGVYSSDPYRFVVDVTAVFDPPYFTQALKNIELTKTELAADDFVIALPPVSDNQNDRITTFNVKLGSAATFASYDAQTRSIVIKKDEALAFQTGSFPILIILKDETGATSQQSFTIRLKLDND